MTGLGPRRRAAAGLSVHNFRFVRCPPSAFTLAIKAAEGDLAMQMVDVIHQYLLQESRKRSKRPLFLSITHNLSTEKEPELDVS
jgi:hypothetical protein